jgi:hypothetical protein
MVARKARSLDQAAYHRELKGYLNEPAIDANSNVLEYWIFNQTKYPKLYNLAQKYLVLPASSTASERMVSSLNYIADPKRSRLTARNIDNLVFLFNLDISIWKELMVSTFLLNMKVNDFDNLIYSTCTHQNASERSDGQPPVCAQIHTTRFVYVYMMCCECEPC